MTYEQILAHKIHDVMKKQLGESSGRLRKVLVRIDEMENIDVVKLNATWQQIATERVFQSSSVEVHRDPPFGRCALCNQDFELSSDTSRCPYCRHEQFKIIHEPPTIETYEMEQK